MKHLILLFSFSIFIFNACSPKSSDLRGRRPEDPIEQKERPVHSPVARDKIEWLQVDGGSSELQFNPKVDILFVEDNSGSMKGAQENLTRNINRFAEAFEKNKIIDYHLGVISVWDSAEKYVNNPRRIYDIGQLRPVKNGQGQVLKENFVTRKNGTPDVLASTLKIGIAGQTEPSPEFEEIFSALSGAIKKGGTGEQNEGFFRPDAHLVVVLLTDTDDSTSGISPEQMAEELKQFKPGPQGPKLSVYGVLVRAEDSDEYKDYDLKIHPNYHPECFDFAAPKKPINNGKCKGFGPELLDRFIVHANSEEGTPEQIKAKYIIGLAQKDFGKDLARIGNEISQKALSKEILLDQRPRTDENGEFMIRVRYGTPAELARKDGGQLIPQDPAKGWIYDSTRNLIRLSSEIEYAFKEGARFSVEFVPYAVGDQLTK